MDWLLNWPLFAARLHTARRTHGWADMSDGLLVNPTSRIIESSLHLILGTDPWLHNGITKNIVIVASLH
eukprot:11212029-Lingulodinium_polyedra.AAC.1